MALVVNDRRKPLELAIRKFVFCSYRVFEDIERRADEAQKITDSKNAATDLRAVLFHGSRLFRDQISTLLSDIDLLQSTFFNENNSEYLFQAEYDLAAYLSTTWHLCEIFFLNHTNSNSLEIIQWFQMNGVPSVDLESTLETFRSTENPQYIAQSESDDVNGYWETIFALILEGKLVDVWEILSLHREVSDIIASNERNNNDRNILEAIHDVLNSHPYIHLVAFLNTNNDDESASIPPSMPLEFKDWQEKVSRILQSKSSLLGRISELSTVLLMLVGDKDTLVEQSRGEWTSLGIGLFLYVYPPPLMRANISKIVESVMKMAIRIGDISPEEIQKETRQREKMCDIMNGDASSVLMNLVEVCGWGNPLTDFCSLFGLISVSHLTYLLAKSGVAAATLTGGRNQDILGELLGVGRQAGALSATFPNEAPFVEELFLESVQRLNALQFPLEIVSGYLRACPLRGADHARVLLPRRRITSDGTVHAICHALRAFGLSAEAKALEASRGSWWLQQSERNKRPSGSGGKVVKALQFYERAGDSDRAYALLDRTLWRCCTALVNASQALNRHSSSGISSSSSINSVNSVYSVDESSLTSRYLYLIPRNMKIHPVRPRGASVWGVSGGSDHWDLRHYLESSEGGQGVSGMDGGGGVEPAEVLTLDVAVQRLFSAIGDAEELLGAVINTDTISSYEAVSLKVFVSVIRALLTVTLPVTGRTEWTNSLNLTQGLVGIPIGDWKMLNQLGGGILEGEEAERKMKEVLRFASDSVCGLMSDELAPMRFWLPLLELCVGLDGLMDRKRCPCLYSKTQAYGLLESAERVISVHSHYNLNPSTVNPGASSANKIIEEDNHRSLRLSLLGILSGSVIQAHADAGYTRVKNDDEIRALKITDFQRLKTPMEKIRRQNALEMLSVSAFL